MFGCVPAGLATRVASRSSSSARAAAMQRITTSAIVASQAMGIRTRSICRER